MDDIIHSRVSRGKATTRSVSRDNPKYFDVYIYLKLSKLITVFVCIIVVFNLYSI